jgi:phenylacetic acid degradation operon negative regulatory protein
VPRAAESLIGALLERLQPKAKSLIVTVYGDAISQHGGNAALGSVIALLRPLGLNERSVRTTMHRLAQEGWLQSVAFGRRSDYRLTETGRRRMDAAHDRIYRDEQRPWDRQWTIVAMAPAALTDEARESLRRDLGWLGFGHLSAGVMLHPDPDEGALQALLAAQGHNVLVVRGPAARRVAGEAFEDVVRACWDLDRLAADYTTFLETFRPAWNALHRADQLDPELAFALRSLLMHALRRAILRDPMLPDELMPHGWPGAAARTLSRNLYRLVEAAAERHVMSVLETAEGPVPDAEPAYFERFGGLRGAGSMLQEQTPTT